MRIAQLRMKNWLPFRGEHTLDFEGKAYAIVARRVDDEEASNWSGKSSLVEAIRFALTGWHRMRLDDEWITRGEKSGEIEQTFDTGERILRSREVGRPTKLYYWPAGVPADKPFYGKEAQAEIEKRIGLDADDFLATCYFEQRQMARLILARPEDRMSMISAWLRLAPLERCEDKARARVNDLIAQADVIKSKRDVARGRLVAEAQHKSRELCIAEHQEAHEAWLEAKKVVEKLETEWQENEQRRRAQEIREDFAQLVKEGKALDEEINESNMPALIEAHDAARAFRDKLQGEKAKAQERARQLGVVARGEFDGKCPIADITCPAMKTINESRSKNTKAHKEAVAACDALALRVSDAVIDDQRTWGQRNEVQRKIDKLHQLRAQAEKLIEAVDAAANVEAPKPADLLRSQLGSARSFAEECARKAHEKKLVLDTFDEVARIEADCDQASASIDTELRLMQAALSIFGKNGAQRRVAEEVLGHIENEANERLAQCGIPLSVRVQWSREGTGLSKACESCGAAFPKSEKVKACARCGAARGPQLVNKLDFLLSDRSGAAEDLVGIAVQLAASAWLRADRGSDWNTVVIDEAFGQLDASNRRALSHHLADLVSSEQAFVIAHHAQVLDALPGRIEIVRDGDASKVRIIA